MDAFFLYVETPTNHMHVTLSAVLDQDMRVLDLWLERGADPRWRYDSCWLFARRPAEAEPPEPGPMAPR